jgi:hypothetical protein
MFTQYHVVTACLFVWCIFVIWLGLRSSFGHEAVEIAANQITRVSYFPVFTPVGITQVPLRRRRFRIAEVSNLRYGAPVRAYRYSAPSAIVFDYEFMPQRITTWLDESQTKAAICHIMERCPQLAGKLQSAGQVG